jgi:hypothetical protein
MIVLWENKNIGEKNTCGYKTAHEFIWMNQFL